MADSSEHQGPGAGTLDTASTADSRRGPIAVDANTLDAAPGGPRLADDDDGFPVRGWDRYEFIARIGAGGMGTVYYARDPRLGRDVALKFIRGSDLRLTLRLVREARAQARIDHPNVCKVYEAGEIAGKAYIAMELIDGRPLGECSDLSFHAKLETIRDVARALHEAHKLGILHRDIKPGNIMLAAPDDEGRTRPVVMDFGIAHDRENEDAMTQTGAMLGTPAYMSPEQARSSRDLDRRSDVYSLGVTLFELLAGRPPFAADTPVQVILAVLHDEAPNLATLVPDVPDDIATIVQKCLHKHPGERYDSARALAEDLDRYIRGEPILARPEGWSRRLRRTVRRHRALVLTASLAAIAVVVAAVWGLRQAAEAVAQGQLADERARAARQQTEVALVRARQVREAARVGAARQAAVDDPTTAAMILREVETRDPGELFGWLAVAPHLTRTEYFTRTLLRGHTDAIHASAWSPDGSHIAVASRDGTASVWRPDGTRVAKLTGHTATVDAVAWSPDGARLVTTSEDHTARVWLAEGTAQATLTGHTEPIHAVAWSPDGAHIVTGADDRSARIWRPDGALVATLTGHTSPFHLAAWRPDSSLLVTGSPWDEGARVWRADGALVATLHTRATGVRSVAWSPDGAHVLTASDATTAHLWRPDGALVTRLEHTAVLIQAVWSPDGDKILTTSRDMKANVWRRSGEHVVTLKGHRAEPTVAAWSPDSRQRRRRRGGRRRRTCGRSTTASSPASPAITPTVNAIAWHPDGVQILTSAADRSPPRVAARSERPGRARRPRSRGPNHRLDPRRPSRRPVRDRHPRSSGAATAACRPPSQATPTGPSASPGTRTTPSSSPPPSTTPRGCGARTAPRSRPCPARPPSTPPRGRPTASASSPATPMAACTCGTPAAP
jgi:WD40 repeat protein/predicted Ser/Thr protein kinase